MNFSTRVLSGLALLLVAASAVLAVPCPHNRNIITCCASAKPTYSNGKVIRWTCNVCDDGYKRSSNGQQCIQQKNIQCGRGQGRDYYGNCSPCADKNCQTCSQLWTFCNDCKDGYVTDSNGQCQAYDPCGNGEGLDYQGNCTPCADDNCRECSSLWTECTKCNSGYGLNDDKGCDPLLLG